MLENQIKVLAIVMIILFFGLTTYLTVNAIIDCGWQSLFLGKNVFWASIFGLCN